MIVGDIDFNKSAVDRAVKDGPRSAEYRFKRKPYLRMVVRDHRIFLVARMNRWNVRKSQVLGEYPYLSLSRFEQLGTELYSQFVNSAYPQLTGVTFGEVFEQLFIPLKERERTKSVTKYQQLYRDFVAEGLGPKRLREISSLDVSNALRTVSETRSDAMYNHVRVLIVGVFKAAIAYNLTSFDPTRAVPPRKLDNIVGRYLTAEEIPAFAAACEAFPQSLPHLSLLLALLTGARIGNIISLRKEDVAADFSHLTFRKTKSGRAQAIPISPEAAGIIQKAVAISGPASSFVFSSSRSSTGHISHPRKAFIQVCRRAGIAVVGSNHPLKAGFPSKPITIHGLRKTFATIVLAESGDIACSSQLLGHSSLEVTQRYAFVGESRLAGVVNAVSTRLLGRSTPPASAGSDAPTCTRRESPQKFDPPA